MSNDDPFNYTQVVNNTAEISVISNNPLTFKSNCLQSKVGLWTLMIAENAVVSISFCYAPDRWFGVVTHSQSACSQGLGWSGSRYNAWHKSRSVEISEVPLCSTLGVYLDQPAGLLNLEDVKDVKEGEEGAGGKEVKLLHQVKSFFSGKMKRGVKGTFLLELFLYGIYTLKRP